MAETQIQATEAHYGLLVDIEAGKVFDLIRSGFGETPHLDMPDESPVNVFQLVWDLEQLGWCWRPADNVHWQLTDTGRLAMEGSGL